jgi:hypothetical protein
MRETITLVSADFVPGLELSRRLYVDGVAPLLAALTNGDVRRSIGSVPR